MMKTWNIISQHWRELSITSKFSSAFGLLLALIVLVAITGYVALTVVRYQTEAAILTSTEIQRLVLEMEGSLEEARRLERDFFWRYPSIGFSEARRTYVEQAGKQIGEVVTFSAELQQLIAASDVSIALRKSRINLNLYLSAAGRYAKTFNEAVELAAQLAAPETGLQAQLAQNSASLYAILRTTDDSDLMVLYHRMLSFEKDYLIRRQRPLMQSAFNIAISLNKEIELTTGFEENQKIQASAYLDKYLAIAEDILQLDIAIRIKFNEFDLQAEAVDPISEELVGLAGAEVEYARDRIDRTSRLATVILVTTALLGLVLAAIIANILNTSITRNVIKLTRAAAGFRSDWETSDWETSEVLKTSEVSLDWKTSEVLKTSEVSLDSADELGQLAGSFNAMAARINALLGSLEQKVAERTAELVTTNEQLQQEIIERRQAEEAAEAANRAKSTFLTNMSHELRTPLNSVLGYAQILRRDRNATEFQQERLDVIERSGNHLLNLINEILDLSKIEARKMEIHETAFRFHEFLEGICGMIRIRAHGKGTLFHAEIAPDLPKVVRGDETRLGQILLNLLGNAVKFTDQGRVTLKVSVRNEAGGTPTSEPRKIGFRVEDTGIGIPEDQLDDIFSPFRQVGDHTRKIEGTGLGLAISRKLVRMMGGELHVTSAECRGSTFMFDLELPTATDLRGFENLGGLGSDQKNIIGYKGVRQKILVIDDKEDNRNVLTGLLQPLGFEIIEAADGCEGLDKASEHEPDMVLTDLVMPVTDGFECIRGIRSLPQLRHIGIIVISASTPAEPLEMISSASCDDFIPKPVQAAELFNKLAHHLRLEWVYASDPEPGPGESDETGKKDGDFVIPPFSEAETLYKLGMSGKVIELCRELDMMEQTDERYGPFVQELRGLARAFQVAEIRELLKKYLGGHE